MIMSITADNDNTNYITLPALALPNHNSSIGSWNINPVLPQGWEYEPAPYKPMQPCAAVVWLETLPGELLIHSWSLIASSVAGCWLWITLYITNPPPHHSGWDTQFSLLFHHCFTLCRLRGFFFCQLTEYMSEHRFHLKALEKSVTALKSFWGGSGWRLSNIG